MVWAPWFTDEHNEAEGDYFYSPALLQADFTVIMIDICKNNPQAMKTFKKDQITLWIVYYSIDYILPYSSLITLKLVNMHSTRTLY